MTEWSTPSVLRMQYNYTWEHDGRVGFARNLDDETLDRYYGYDHVGRLTVSRSGNEARLAINEQVPLIQNGPYSHGYFYDKFGNITQREGWGGTNPVYTVTYNNNKMNGMTYDAAGNLTDAGGGWTFTYDATGQQVTSAVGGVQNVYDGNRLRGKKTESGTTFYYLRSSVLGGQVVAEVAANGDWARGFVYMGKELLAIQIGGVYWVHQDPVVKSKRITNSSGTVVSTIELDPWGGETSRNNNQDFQPYKFGSYYRDGIGSDDAMNRRYNRWWTRFEQADPYDGSYNLSNPQSFNRFAYVQNDPVNLIDPTGLFCVWRERWDERTATLYVTEECYLEDGGGGGGTLVPREPSGGGGGGGIGGGGGGVGGGLGPRTPSSPSPTANPQTKYISQKQLKSRTDPQADCIRAVEKEKAAALKGVQDKWESGWDITKVGLVSAIGFLRGIPVGMATMAAALVNQGIGEMREFHETLNRFEAKLSADCGVTSHFNKGETQYKPN
jgi:RHS repeat-associated protein